jgi:TPR repeat protein
MKRLLLTLVLLWPVAGLADFDVAWKAWQRQDFVAALREWQPLADAKAQHWVGVVHNQGVPLNYREAAKWFRLSAMQGFANAQITLGFKYAHGGGILQDDVRGFAWLSLAEANDDEAAWAAARLIKSEIRKRMTPAQLAEAQKLSKTLCAKISNCAQ